MAFQTLGLGSSANDGTGDTLRAAGTKINANTGEIYARFGSGSGNGATLESATAANILVGNGTKFASVATSGDFTISTSGAMSVRNNEITIPTGSTPGSTTNKLYNVGGALYFNGASVGTGSVSGMTQMRITGDSGGNKTVTNNEIVTIAGGTGITSVASDDQTVTLNIDATVATLAGTQVLTNKTLTSPSVSGLTLSDASIVLEGATANAFETTLTVTDPTADRTITFPDATGTVALTTDITVTATSSTVFTNKTLTSAVLNTGVSGTAIKDEDNMSSDSATHLATQQSIKAYVDANSLSLIDEDNMASDSATRPPSQQSVKAYVTANAGSTITVQEEGSSLSTAATTLNFVGAGVTATGSGATKTITVGSGVSTLAALTDTAISSAAAGNILLHDGSDSFDNKAVKVNDVTLSQTAALAIPMGAAVYTISASGNSAYLFNDYESDGSNGSNEHLYLLADLTYIFDLRALAGSHPFQIQASTSALTASNGADGLIHIANNGTVSTGTSANGKTEGFLIWKVPHFATASTGTYRYICTSHSSMVGSITIKTLEQLS